MAPLLPTDYERAGDFTNAYYIDPVSKATVRGPVSVCTAYTQTTTTASCTAWGTKVTNISPTAAAYIKDIYSKLPLPPSAADVAAGLDPHSYTYNQRNVFNDTQELVRIDHTVSRKLSVFYRYLHDSLPSQEPGGLFNGSTLPGVSNSNTTAPGTQHLGHATYTFTPTLLVDAGYAYSYGAVISQPAGSSASVNATDIKPTLPFSTATTAFSTSAGVVPSISSTGISAISNVGVYNDLDHNNNFYGDVTKTLGQHTFKAGVTYNRYRKQENAQGAQQGRFTFSSTGFLPTTAQLVAGSNIPTTADASFANFLLGNANGGFTQSSAALTPHIQQNLFEAYIQDDWKVQRRLTLNLGVRYSYFAQPIDTGGILSNFDPDTFVAANAQTVASNGVLCIPSVATCQNANGLNRGAPNPIADPLNGIILGTPASYGHASPFGSQVATNQKLNFAPRLGFAYDVFGDSKTALRGGYGTAFDQSQVNIYETPGFNNAPFVNQPTLSFAPLDCPGQLPGCTTPGATAAISSALPNVYGFTNHYKTPYTMQFSLDIQQQITSTFMLDVGYFGAMGRHLQGVSPRALVNMRSAH